MFKFFLVFRETRVIWICLSEDFDFLGFSFLDVGCWLLVVEEGGWDCVFDIYLSYLVDTSDWKTGWGKSVFSSKSED